MKMPSFFVTAKTPMHKRLVPCVEYKPSMHSSSGTNTNNFVIITKDTHIYITFRYVALDHPS